MIHVFLKNKIISTDAIVPLLLDVRRQGCERPMAFYLQSSKTEQVLRDNAVLWAALQRLGKVQLAVAADRSPLGYLRHRLWAIFWLLGLSWSLLTGQAKIIHFGQLYHSPYRFLLHLRPNAVLLVDAAFASFSTMQKAFAKLKEDRQNGFDLTEAPVVMAFSAESDIYKGAKGKGKRVFLGGPPHLLRGWIDYVDGQADHFLGDRLAGQEIIAVILGYFGPLDFMRDPDSVTRLFEETLDILIAEAGGRPIVIKPHVISDMAVVNAALARRPGANISITNLHPSVLATRARFFIANYYSTVLSTVGALGGLTVEYTDYSDHALELSGGQSMRPDSVTHFIQRDAKRLVAVMRDMLAQPRRNGTLQATEAPADLVAYLAS